MRLSTILKTWFAKFYVFSHTLPPPQRHSSLYWSTNVTLSWSFCFFHHLISWKIWIYSYDRYAGHYVQCCLSFSKWKFTLASFFLSMLAWYFCVCVCVLLVWLCCNYVTLSYQLRGNVKKNIGYSKWWAP